MYTKNYSNPPEFLAQFNTILSSELLDVVCGEMLGEGISRRVYQCRLNADLVVKIETQDGQFYNIHEWAFWNKVGHYSHVGKWLAPCHMISANGRILVQSKTSPIPQDFKMPEKIPTWMTDTHRRNFGLYEGRVVTHDYAIHLGLENGALSKRMRKAEWYA